MLICLLIFGLLTRWSLAEVFSAPKGEDPAHWNSIAAKDIEEAMFAATTNNWNVAKNVVLFVGDGMGITVTSAARIYKGQQRRAVSGEETYLSWERFPNMGLMKTYNIDKQVPDSAATATAFMTGTKANVWTLGVDNTVSKGQCLASLDPKTWRSSIMDWSQKAGKHTGFVTTTRVTHATPAALYAHSANRNWECDSKLRSDGHGCRDIAKQLVEDTPGKDANVVLGGGRFPLGINLTNTSKTDCIRSDRRNLTNEWLLHKRARGYGAKFVQNTKELEEIDIKSTDYLMGLFSDNHMDYESDRDRGPMGQPSLANMTATALKILSKNKQKGFFLMVEGGRIDHALHMNEPRRTMDDMLAFDDALATALSMVNLKETLVIVTADHSHVMTMNGYPSRGNNILGVSDEPSDMDNKHYTTLMFANGPGFQFSWNGTNVTRPDPSKEDTTRIGYQSQVTVPMKYETHGGEDVAAYAIGPMSHLLHRVHEQTYIAHVMGFAACIGPYKDKCERPAPFLPRFVPPPPPLK